MEFTRSERLGKQGRRYRGWGLVATAGGIVWLSFPRADSDHVAVVFTVFAALIALAGQRMLRTSRKPFRLRIDEHGLTLHDGRLRWDQIDGIGLRYGESSDSYEVVDGRITGLAAPRLYLYPAEGAPPLDRRTEYVRGRWGYALADTAHIDQGLSALIEALKRHAGPRFEGAPRWTRDDVAGKQVPAPPDAFGTVPAFLRSVVPTAAGPADAPPPQDAAPVDTMPQDAAPVDAAPGEAAPSPGNAQPPWASPVPPGKTRTFSVAHNSARWLGLSFLVALYGTLSILRFVLDGDALLGQQSFPLLVLAAGAGWYGTGRFLRRVRRPLRLRIGPDGIGMREFGGTELFFRWDQMAAVAVDTLPSTTAKHPCVLVWPVPGESFVLNATDLIDGHATYALVEPRRLLDGAEVESVLRYFAGPRYAARDQLPRHGRSGRF